jgi:hypothetical protein
MLLTALKVFVLAVFLLLGAVFSVTAFGSMKDNRVAIDWLSVGFASTCFAFAFLSAIALRPTRRL